MNGKCEKFIRGFGEFYTRIIYYLDNFYTYFNNNLFCLQNPSNDTKTKNEDHDTHYIEEKPGKTDCTDDYIWIILAMVFVILIFHH